eukprot:scaffold50853_cov33-Phaeocystis_antarctica.AAC.2
MQPVARVLTDVRLLLLGLDGAPRADVAVWRGTLPAGTQHRRPEEAVAAGGAAAAMGPYDGAWAALCHVRHLIGQDPADLVWREHAAAAWASGGAEDE